MVKKPATRRAAPTAKELTQTVAVKLTAKAEFARQGIEIFVSRQVVEGTDLGPIMDDLIEQAQPKIDAYAEEYDLFEVPPEFKEEEYEEEEDADEDADEDDEPEVVDEEDEDAKEDEDAEEDDWDEDEEEEEDEDVTEEQILKMKKAELLELIEDEELELNPKKFKKIADLRQAIIDELFEEEDEPDDDEESDDDEDWGEDDWDDED